MYGSDFLRSALASRFTRCCLILSLCLYLGGFFASPAISAEFYPEDFFGSPEEFYESFHSDIKSKLDSYLGASLAISFFVLIARGFTKG